MKKTYLYKQYCQACGVCAKKIKNQNGFNRRFDELVLKKINQWKNEKGLTQKISVAGDFVCHVCYKSSIKHENSL